MSKETEIILKELLVIESLNVGILSSLGVKREKLSIFYEEISKKLDDLYKERYGDKKDEKRK